MHRKIGILFAVNLFYCSPHGSLELSVFLINSACAEPRSGPIPGLRRNCWPSAIASPACLSIDPGAWTSRLSMVMANCRLRALGLVQEAYALELQQRVRPLRRRMRAYLFTGVQGPWRRVRSGRCQR